MNKLKFYLGDTVRIKKNYGTIAQEDGQYGQILEFDESFARVVIKGTSRWYHTDALEYGLREYIAINSRREISEWDTLEEAFKFVGCNGGTILRFADLDWPLQKVWTFNLVSKQYWHMCGEQEQPI